MKYKVVKEFDSLKKGDILENSTEDPEIFSFEEETDTRYKYVSYSKSIIDDLVENKYLTLIEVRDEDEGTCYSDYLEDKIVGDVIPNEKLYAISKVPGGVGKLTTLYLFENLLRGLKHDN